MEALGEVDLASHLARAEAGEEDQAAPSSQAEQVLRETHQQQQQQHRQQQPSRHPEQLRGVRPEPHDGHRQQADRRQEEGQLPGGGGAGEPQEDALHPQSDG